MVEVATGPSDSATREKVGSRRGAAACVGQRGAGWTAGALSSVCPAPHGPEGAQTERLTAGPV